jgi:hypothetical protein
MRGELTIGNNFSFLIEVGEEQLLLLLIATSLAPTAGPVRRTHGVHEQP